MNRAYVKVMCIVCMVIASINAWAGHGDFYTDPGSFILNDSSLCPSGYVVQTIHLYTGSEDMPPTANSANSYLDPNEQLSNSPQTCNEMGTDLMYSWYFGDGKLGALVSGPGFGKHGYVRAYSSTTIQGAAYFGNSPCEPIGDPDTAGSDNPIVEDVRINRVNPAYVIPFLTVPNAPISEPEKVEGQVNSSAPGGVNQLQSAWILIEWSEDDGDTWSVGEETLAANGSFSFTPGVEATILVRARVKDANTERVGFPISASYPVTVVPEPGLLLGLGLVVLGITRRLYA